MLKYRYAVTKIVLHFLCFKITIATSQCLKYKQMLDVFLFVLDIFEIGNVVLRFEFNKNIADIAIVEI